MKNHFASKGRLRLSVIFSMIVCSAIFSVFISCASKPKFTGCADLCGLVVDEKNRPVQDFLIYCRGSMGENHTALTNESGIFVIQNVPCGSYEISGQKTQFMELEKTEYSFFDRTKIFCCQVFSFDAAMDSVLNLMQRGENKQAEKVLNSVTYENNSAEEAVIQFYKFYLTDSNKDRLKIIAKLRRLSVHGINDCSAFADTLEESIYEN